MKRDDQDALTRVWPGSLMGDLVRQYWIPALLSEDLPGADVPGPGRVPRHRQRGRPPSPSPVEGLGEGDVGSGKPRPPGGSMVVVRS